MVRCLVWWKVIGWCYYYCYQRHKDPRSGGWGPAEPLPKALHDQLWEVQDVKDLCVSPALLTCNLWLSLLTFPFCCLGYWGDEIAVRLQRGFAESPAAAGPKTVIQNVHGTCVGIQGTWLSREDLNGGL